MKKLNFLTNLFSPAAGWQSNDVSVDRRLTVGSPSGFGSKSLLKLVSVLVLILTVGVGQMWGETFTKITSLASLTTGDYVIVGQKGSSDFGRLTYGTLSSSRIPYSKHYTSAPASTITTTTANEIWHIEVSGTGDSRTITIYNAGQKKYLNPGISWGNSSSNWTATYSSGFRFQNPGNTNYLGVNSSANYWKNYASGTLYATYGLTLYKAPSGFALTFKETGGSSNGSGLAAANATSMTISTAPTPATGKMVEGYYAENTLTTKVANADGSWAANNITGWVTSGKFTKGTAADLYIKWTDLVTTLTLDKGTDGTTDGTATITYNATSFTSKTDATKTGYHLSGYYTASSGGNKVINADGALVSSLSGWTSSGKWVKNATTEKLYAQWTIDDYTVSWSVNGNSWSTGVSSSNNHANYNNKITAMPTAPTSSNCDNTKVFVGWTATPIVGTQNTPPSDLFTAVEGSPKITQNTTFYAVFATNATTATRVTATNSITSGDRIAICNDKDSYILLSTFATAQSQPSENGSGEISISNANQQWLLNGDNTNGYTLTNGTIRMGSSGSSSGSSVSNNANRTLWTFTTSNVNSNCLAMTNKSSGYRLEYSGGWVHYNSTNAGWTSLKVYKVNYSAYATSCCTKLGSINGSISLTQGGNSVTISGWSDVANVGTYTVRMYKKNGASWDLVSGTTSGGSAGTPGTRTGITSGSKSVTYTGLVVESEYKFTVQAIAGSASYCDGDETEVTTINSTSVSSTPFKFRYAIYIDDGTNDNYEYHYITPTGNTDEGSVDIDLTAHITSYQFKIAGGFSGWWGQTGTSNIPASTKWTLNGSNNVKLNTGAGGTYTFTVDYSGTTNPGVTVTFPSANQASGYKIYFDKSIIDGWGSTLKYRIGNNTDNQNQNFTLVTGTDNFYVTTTPSYNSMDAWQIANNTAWTPGDHDAAHGIYNYHHGDDYDITKATVYFDYVVDGDITMVPSSKKNTENGCDFWYTNKTSGMLQHTATITAPSNGTINLAYTNTSGTSCPTNTSTVSNLAHRTILTATANPSTGYQLSTFTVTPSGESAQNLSSGDNHILAKDATFAATFSAKTYSISLDRNGGTTGATGVTMTYNSSSFTGWSAPTRTGYTFDGYYTSETDDNGSGTLVINSSGVLQANVDGYTGANGIWTKDATCTLYAKWTANTTTVTLTAGTGTNGSASINYDATSYTSFSAAVRVGYTCTGYWTNTGGTGTKILNANGSFAASTISGYVTSDKWSYTTASTLTLYAGWTNTYAGYVFDLLEDVRDISAGSKIILIGTNAAGNTFKAMSTTQGNNNRGSVAAGSGEFVMSNSNKTATLGASTSVQVITLEDLATPADNTYQFNVENGYLYAAGTSNALLKTQAPNSAYGHWLVAVDANTKKATMTGQGGNSYNKIYFNSSSSIFSGYNSAQQPTYIYFNETRTKYTITWDKNGHGTAPTYPTNAARVTMPDISVTGYTNAGWIADKAVTNVSSGATINAGTLIPKDTRVQLSANTTFTAQWTTDVYTISATLTNITVSSAFPSALTYTGETTTDLDRTLSVTSAYVLPTNLTVTMGGNACTNGTEYTYDSSTGEFTFIVAVTGNIVITGTALNKYTITLNPGNGSLSEGGGWSADGENLVQVVVEGNNVTLPTPTPSCAGWVFKGWKLGSAANNQSSFTPDKADGATFAPNATSTYYAVYRASTPTGTTYTKITDEAELTTGDYLIVGYPGSSYYYAMGNSITSGHMTETSSTNATSWSSPSAGSVWTIIKAGDKVGFYNANASKFLTIVDGAWVLNSTDGQKFSYSFNSTTKAWTFTSPSGKQMIYNSYFYTGDAQSSAIYLYKRGNTESGNYYTSPDCSSLTVTGVSDPVGAATVHLSSTTAKDGDVIWVTYTLNRGYTFDSWSKSGTGASLSSTSAEFTKLTVGSTAPTVTANCDALTSYTLNYHDGDGSHTMTVYEGEKILEVLPEPSESCDGTSTTLMGWSTSEIRTKTDDAPTYVSASAVVNSTTAASTYYAVYAKEETPDGTLSILGSLGSSFWGASYNSNDKEIDDSNDNTITLNTDNVIFQNPSSNPTVQIKNASGAGIWNDTELPGSITQIKVKAYTAGLKLYVGTSKKPTSTNEKTISSTSEQTYDFDASDGLTYFSVFSNSATPQITSIIITYTGEYGDYITTCCDAAELEFTTSVYENQIRQDLAGNVGSGNKFELEIPFTTSSTSTTYTTAVKKLTGGDKRSESDAAGTAVDGVGGHASVTVDAVNKKITLQVWSTNPGSNFTGQGTYRVKLTQESNATYCEGVDYVFVDIVMRDKFVDNVNGNVIINKDGTGSALTAPAESDMDVEKDDDCGGQTRRLLGWIKETDLQTIYGNDGETGYLDDAAKYEANKSKIKAPGASITTSAVTWYAVWGIDNTPAP